MNSQGDNSTEKLRSGRRLFRIVLIVIILAGVVVYVHGIQRVSPKSIEDLIEQNLPTETDEHVVLRFLDIHRIIHTDYDPQLQKIWAGVNKSQIGLFNAHINIVFTFNKSGKLVSHSVQQIFNWP